ncbi:hypothetical protein R6Q59_003125 [Mikania micrantha]
MPISEKEEANEKHMTYGPKIASENVETGATKETNSPGKDVSFTNVSKTSAEEVNDAEVKPCNSKFIPSVFQSHASGSIKSDMSTEKKRCHGCVNQNYFWNDRSCYFQRSSCGSNSSFYAPYEKKQTCFACGKPSHIARNCIHRPTEFYQKVTPKVKVCSNPRKFERAKVVNHPKPNDKPRGIRKGEVKRNKTCLKHQKFQKYESVKKCKVNAPKVLKQFAKPKQIWRVKSTEVPIFNGNKKWRLHELCYTDSSG